MKTSIHLFFNKLKFANNKGFDVSAFRTNYDYFQKKAMKKIEGLLFPPVVSQVLKNSPRIVFVKCYYRVFMKVIIWILTFFFYCAIVFHVFGKITYHTLHNDLLRLGCLYLRSSLQSVTKIIGKEVKISRFSIVGINQSSVFSLFELRRVAWVRGYWESAKLTRFPKDLRL